MVMLRCLESKDSLLMSARYHNADLQSIEEVDNTSKSPSPSMSAKVTQFASSASVAMSIPSEKPPIPPLLLNHVTWLLTS